MKNSSLLSLFTCLFLVSMLIGCGSEGGDAAAADDQSTESTEMEEGEDMSGPEYTSAYVCPMHCAGSGSDAMGTCPECGMEYVANPDMAAPEGEAHDHDDHEGHEH